MLPGVAPVFCLDGERLLGQVVLALTFFLLQVQLLLPDLDLSGSYLHQVANNVRIWKRSLLFFGHREATGFLRR